MKTLACLCVAAFALLAVAPVKADSVFDVPPNDPRIILAGAGGSTPVGESFSFGSTDLTAISSTVSFIDFQNVSGTTFFNLVITITNAAFGQNLTCAALDYFTGCSVDAAGTAVTFFGLNGDTLNGIPTGSLDQLQTALLTGPSSHFQLYFVGLPQGQDLSFQGTANVSEPGALLLALSGLGLVAIFKKR